MSRNRHHPKEFRHQFNEPWCLYCGEPSQVLDHFPPHFCGLHGYLFPACSECNLIAGVNYPQDLEMRIQYVKDRIYVKYFTVLNMPSWSEDEIQELGIELQHNIRYNLAKKQNIEQRLKWDAISYLKTIFKNIGRKPPLLNPTRID